MLLKSSRTIHFLLLFLHLSLVGASYAADDRGRTGHRPLLNLMPSARFCRVLLENYKLERIRATFGDDAAYFYEETVLSPFQFPVNNGLRKKVFHLLVSTGADRKSIAVLKSAPYDLKAILENLLSLPHDQQWELLGSSQQLEEYINSRHGVRETQPKQDIDLNKFVFFEKTYVPKNVYTYAENIRKELLEKGVETKLTLVNYHPYLNSPSVIVEIRNILSDAHPVMSSTDFLSALAAAKKSNGHIAIDPVLNMTALRLVDAYATSTNENGWLIAFSKSVSKSSLIHEMTHIEDYILLPERFKDSLLTTYLSELPEDSSPLRKALRKTAVSLEGNMQTEMNATGNQIKYKKYWIIDPTASPQKMLADALNIVLYRTIMGSNLALSRIALEPGVPRHYLAFGKYGILYPIAIGITASEVSRLLVWILP